MASRTLCVVFVLALCAPAVGDTVAVQHPEGNAQSELRLIAPNGALLADGELVQQVHESRVTTRVTFRFKDGSLHEETVVFSQQGEFRFISDHLVQKGPSFPRPVDVSIDGVTGDVTVEYSDHGRLQRATTRLNPVPGDLANGLLITLLKNGNRDRPFTSVSWVAATPKPRLVKLELKSATMDSDPNGGAAIHYVLHVDVGGFGGFLAPVVGKQPPDVHVWVERGSVPAFIRSQQPLYVGGPVWKIEAPESRR